MKKPIYLYILLGLSFISSLFELKGIFFYEKVEVGQIGATGNAAQDKLLAETAKLTEKIGEFSTGTLNKLLAVLMFLLLVAVLVLLIKKEIIKANYVYLASLLLSLARSIYSFTYIRSLSSMISDSANRQLILQGFNIALWISLGIFAIFFGLTVYKLWSYQKASEKVDVAA